MEIDITDFFLNADPCAYSASQMELGKDAGKITWAAALADYKRYRVLNSPAKREAFRAYVKGFGAWTEGEIAEWNNAELNALCLQFIAGDIREAEALDWDTENCGGRICRPCDSVDGRAYYYLGD